jgi:hypothetical protein
VFLIQIILLFSLRQQPGGIPARAEISQFTGKNKAVRLMNRYIQQTCIISINSARLYSLLALAKVRTADKATPGKIRL